MAYYKPDFVCYFCNKITDAYVEFNKFFYCVDCDFNRRTLVNVKSGALISFDSQQDMLNFKFNCEHLGHYNSWIITLHEQKESTLEEIKALQEKPYQTNDMKFVEESGI